MQEALITKRSVHLQVQLFVLMMNGKDSSSLYRLAHNPKPLFILEAQFTSLQWKKKSLFPQSGCTVARSVWNPYKINSPQKSGLILIVGALKHFNVSRCHVDANLTQLLVSYMPFYITKALFLLLYIVILTILGQTVQFLNVRLQVQAWARRSLVLFLRSLFYTLCKGYVENK